jgi:RNA polymerase sigma-70 factor (ECF subfamily)
MSETRAVVEHLFRHEAGRMVSTLARILGSRHLELAEAVVHDALVKALETWPFMGVPDNPSAWLIQVAKNRAIDALRRDRSLEEKTPDVIHAFSNTQSREAAFKDDQLAMMFLCCHPALNRPARIALTLKLVGGFSVGEIARAFLTEETAIAQRLVRAKRQIRDEGLSFSDLSTVEIDERLDSVLDVVYLMFTEGYSPRAGDELIRNDIAEEAVYLGRMLTADTRTAVPQTHALLALMLFHSARSPARSSPEGELLLLAHQDRSRWDRNVIAEAFTHLDRSADGDRVTAYHVQAGIAAAHAAASAYEFTDWTHICDLYDHLYELSPTPVVQLNRAVAYSRANGALAALPMLLDLERDQVLRNYHLLPAVIAELYRELGLVTDARNYYEQALALECSGPERRFVERRLAEFTSS